MQRLGDLLLGHSVHELFLFLLDAAAVLAVAQDPELTGHAAVGLQHDPGQDLLALLQPQALDVEVGHPDPPRVMVGVLAVVGGDALGEPLQQRRDLGRRGGHCLRLPRSAPVRSRISIR